MLWAQLEATSVSGCLVSSGDHEGIEMDTTADVLLAVKCDFGVVTVSARGR